MQCAAPWGVTYMAAFWGCSPHCKSIAMPSQSIGLAQCCLAIDQGHARGLMFVCTCRGVACDRKRCSRMPSRKKEINMSVIIIVSIIIIITIIAAKSIIIPLALQIAHSSCSPTPSHPHTFDLARHIVGMCLAQDLVPHCTRVGLRHPCNILRWDCFVCGVSCMEFIATCGGAGQGHSNQNPFKNTQLFSTEYFCKPPVPIYIYIYTYVYMCI